jgi:hypothetical protein
MAEWTMDDVAARLAEAAETGRRLPRVGVQGYFNVWPEFKREPWEVMGSPQEGYRPLPPTPEAIDRMLEAMRWMQWLEVDERHLVWMRAKHYEWKFICRRLGRDRTTAWRRWQKALQLVADHLNDRQTAAAGHASKLEGQVGQCVP